MSSSKHNKTSPLPKARSSSTESGVRPLRHIAVVGAGIAGLACARTLVQAGHKVTVFERAGAVGGRTASIDTAFGTFDHGAQYFTVRDQRFSHVLQTTPGLCKPWSANTVRVLDAYGLVAAASLPAAEAHFVPSPSMDALARRWAQPLVAAGSIELSTQVTLIARDALQPKQWQLSTVGTPGASDAQHVFCGFDDVVLAVPHAQAVQLLRASHAVASLVSQLDVVQVGPCWTLMLAFPQAAPTKITHLGPQWNAARSTHHRIAWLARESSKPGRGSIERWTVQASAAWSAEHLQDDAPRVQAKLLKAFSEVTGIRAEPSHAAVYGWHQAQTITPLGKSHLWDKRLAVGICGDWCLGHRVENAFVSGLELALSMA